MVKCVPCKHELSVRFRLLPSLMKKLLKQQSKFVVAKIIPSEFHPSFLVSQFLKKSLREKRS